ncbi:MAG: hypothetical protein KKE30_12845 [Gammaproteobacteria bacterium]|nr:hypothetical protein [Gammaproteobacteria bacterium]MBU1555609.1 hypothetical protein [Gammaproteobacteria bacterium]MBU2069909.1 hypothetical protein [Gammaproteobacteria bacterium]MBU2184809.1 hypothetical protein [Gammaproteobacteria bacterium]MBU2204345.1 hypothetical protein [Gammaproteobacteria bacterium]
MVIIRFLFSFCFLLLFFLNFANAKNFEYLNSEFCKDVVFGDFGFEDRVKYNFPELKKRKLFVGQSRAAYNKNDYYLWIYSHDFEIDGVLDLVAIDWHQRSKDVYYLSLYIFKDKGGFISDLEAAKTFFRGENIYPRNRSGVYPIIPEHFFIEYEGGVVKEESFVGYHKIIPIVIDGITYIYAEKNLSESKRALIFDISKSDISLACIYDL